MSRWRTATVVAVVGAVVLLLGPVAWSAMVIPEPSGSAISPAILVTVGQTVVITPDGSNASGASGLSEASTGTSDLLDPMLGVAPTTAPDGAGSPTQTTPSSARGSISGTGAAPGPEPGPDAGTGGNAAGQVAAEPGSTTPPEVSTSTSQVQSQTQTQAQTQTQTDRPESGASAATTNGSAGSSSQSAAAVVVTPQRVTEVGQAGRSGKVPPGLAKKSTQPSPAGDG